MIKLAKLTGVGAKDLQFLFDHYSGIIGDILLPIDTPRTSFWEAMRKVSVGRFETDPAYSSQGVQDFYDARDKANTAAQSKTAREGLNPKIQTDEKRFNARLNAVAGLMTDGNNYIRSLKANDPKAREVRLLMTKYADKAAKATTIAEVVNITNTFRASMYSMGVPLD